MIYIYYGPTGSGKTDLAIAQILKNRKELQKDGEIISADSRQIYIGMDIGTNKDKEKYIRNKINYHLIGILTPDKKFSVWDWNQMCKEKLQEIRKKGNDIYIVGGTGLYIDSLLYPRSYSSSILDLKVNLKQSNDDHILLSTIQDLFIKDFPIDYERLNESERKNKRRLTSNYFKLKNATDLKIVMGEEINNFVLEEGSFKLITPQYSRENLYERINKRVDKMFEEGFVNEVRELIKSGYKDSEALNGSGYKEIVKYITDNNENEVELNKVIEAIKKSHRNYAKRQITWFNKYKIDFKNA